MFTKTRIRKEIHCLIVLLSTLFYTSACNSENSENQSGEGEKIVVGGYHAEYAK